MGGGRKARPTWELTEPGLEVGGDEVVVGEAGVGGVDAVEFGGLAGGEDFVRIETEVGGDEALAAEDLEDAGDTAGEGVGGIEEGGVHVGHGHGAGEPTTIEGVGLSRYFDVLEKLDGGVGPDAPVAEQTADDVTGDVLFFFFEGERAQEVGDDGIIVAGVEGDVVATGVDHRADDLEGLVAIKRSDFDREDVFDGSEAGPKIEGEDAATDSGLEVEADERKLLGNGLAVREDFGFGLVVKRRKAKQNGVVTEFARELSFGAGLGSPAAGTSDLDEGAGIGGEGSIKRLAGEFEDRAKEVVLGVADFELSGMHADGESPATGGDVVAGECALVPLGELAVLIECEGERGDGLASKQVSAECGEGVRICHHEFRSEWVCRGRCHRVRGRRRPRRSSNRGSERAGRKVPRRGWRRRATRWELVRR